MARGGQERAGEGDRVSVESAFAKIIGREPSETERARLYHIRDALGLRENDAFWYIVMTLEHYDSLYREYPKLIADQAAETLENARAAFAKAAEVEAARAELVLSERVAETSVAIARKLAERPVRIDRVTAMFAAVTMFGALCMSAGYHVATGERPFWSAHAADGRTRILGVVLGAPAGWMIFLLLLPLAVHTGISGFRRARDLANATREQLWGWGLLGFAVLGTAACLFILSKII